MFGVVCQWLPTRAVQATSQLSGHHLHDESYSESQHVPKQSGLGAHVHGQIDHDFLHDKHTRLTAVPHRVLKMLNGSTQDLKTYLSEYCDTDVLATGFIDESAQLLRRKWPEIKQRERRLDYKNLFLKVCM